MISQIFIPSVVSEKNLKNSLVRYILEKQFPLTLSCRQQILTGFFCFLKIIESSESSSASHLYSCSTYLQNIFQPFLSYIFIVPYETDHVCVDDGTKKIEGKEVHRAVAGLLTIHNSSMARRAARMPTKHIKIGLDLRIASEVISDINGLKLFPIYSCGTKMPFKEKVI